MAGLFDEGEPVFGGAKKPTADGEMDITPMIDCVFQLLIFFMVASNMTGEQEANLPFAKHGIGVETNRSTVISVVAPTGGGKPQLFLEPDMKTPVDITAIQAAVRQNVSQGRTDVIIKAERGLTHGAVQEVARGVNEIEGVRFYVGVKDR
ncbi:MAG: biopolymer transporter ExbD [Planctomycetota bacterium]|nr:biopolymer transporter ExbD [Planctomycetota bacterium]